MSGRSALSRLAIKRSEERGAVAVEFALVLPLLVMLLLGTVTAGVAYSRNVGLTNAVREGARFGAIAPSDGAWIASVQNRTRASQFDGTGAGTQVCAALLKNNNTAAPSATPTTPIQAWQCSGPTVVTNPPTPVPPAVPPSACVALVWAAQPFTIDAGLASWGGTMQRASIARYERTCG
jgi:Flp pilus assembly protein TadG